MGWLKPERSKDEVPVLGSVGPDEAPHPPGEETPAIRKSDAETSKSDAETSMDDAISSLTEVSAVSVAEIDNLITDLQAARSYLQSERDRIQRDARRYAELSQAASVSVKIITENLSAWRNAGGLERNTAN
jgi:hypothetical protein